MSIPQVNINSFIKESWTREEKNNAILIGGFIQNLMNDHDFDTVFKKYNNELYLQHNRSIKDGIPGLIEYVKGVCKNFPEFSYDVKQVLADGDRIIFHSHMTFRKKDRGNEKKGILVVDIWKIVDNQIAEHWDALQPLDRLMRLNILFTGGKISNQNGLFGAALAS